MDIRSHLCQLAAKITDRSLDNIQRLEDWQRQRPARYAQFLATQGLDDRAELLQRPPVQAVTTGRIERADVIIEKLYFQSLAGLYVSANLYLPRNQTAPAPAVLYLCGHSRTQKAHYQPHPRRWAQLGFVCLIMDTIEFGENPGDHHGAYAHGQFHWYSRGYTPAGVEMWNAIRAADLLQQRPEVDAARLGVTGISGGGAISWYAAAADERFRVVAPACATTTVQSQVTQRTWDDNCDCMLPCVNPHQLDLSDIGALIAPRPLLIASADCDECFSIASARACHQKIQQIYALHGQVDQCRFLQTPGRHSYHPDSTRAIFAFFLKHLTGRQSSPDAIDDVAAPVEDDATLQVYCDGLPPDEQISTIQDSFVARSPLPQIGNTAELQTQRQRTLAGLRKHTFAHFPDAPCDLQTVVEFECMSASHRKQRITFCSEPDVRLCSRWAEPHNKAPCAGPALLYLRGADDGRWDFEGFTAPLAPSWRRLAMDCRGVGESGWSPDLDWHIRRTAALTGRTIASMQVYDTLRALAMLRQRPGVDPARIVLAGRRHMAAIAIYAALLDGQVATVVLGDAPPSQDVADSATTGRQGLEMLNCLRYTDLPQAAALLCPAEVVFVGHRHPAYAWTEAVYHRLAARITHVPDLAHWRFAQDLPAGATESLL